MGIGFKLSVGRYYIANREEGYPGVFFRLPFVGRVEFQPTTACDRKWRFWRERYDTGVYFRLGPRELDWTPAACLRRQEAEQQQTRDALNGALEAAVQVA